jgi:DNA polymerase I-like protein with 3'-5' exonuclease and polymerase domains
LVEKQVIAEITKKGKIELTDELYEREVKPEVEDRYKGKCAAIRREGANFHIQSVNADFTKAAMYEIRKEFKRRGWDARMYNSVYDEIVIDFDASIAEEGHEIQKEIMVREANKMLKRVPMETEGHLQTHWTK